MSNKINIKALRKHLKKTQDDFAEQFLVNRTTYATWEKNNQIPFELYNQIITEYSKEIEQFGSSILSDINVEYGKNNDLLQRRIKELETLIQQKDIIIENQRQVIEMMNKTFELQKAQKNSKL